MRRNWLRSGKPETGVQCHDARDQPVGWVSEAATHQAPLAIIRWLRCADPPYGGETTCAGIGFVRGNRKPASNAMTRRDQLVGWVSEAQPTGHHLRQSGGLRCADPPYGGETTCAGIGFVRGNRKPASNAMARRDQVVGWVSEAQPTSLSSRQSGGLRYADPPYGGETTCADLASFGKTRRERDWR